MTKRITVSLPTNISAIDKPLFEPYTVYNLAELKIKKIKNIFLANSGFCIDKKGLVKESHHEYANQYNYYLNEAAKYYYDAIDRPDLLITLDDDNIYLAIHHPWFNYYHWMIESIFRLWMVKDELNKYILVLPEYYRDADFIMSSLEPFKIPNWFFIPNGKSLLVKKLCLPQIKPVCDSYDGDLLRQVRRFYVDYFKNEKQVSTDLGTKIYVSRELAPRRKVLNEAELVDIMKKYGFAVFYPEKFSFAQQVSIFNNARYVVSTQGSGLTNILFMEDEARVFELLKNRTNDIDRPGFVFWYMADALRFKYYCQVCPFIEEEGDYFTDPYLVDTVLFEENLRLMLA